MVLALVAAGCELEPPQTYIDAPRFSLAAGEAREFRVRACFGELDGPDVELGLSVDASVTRDPAGGGAMRLFGRVDDAPGIDIGLPGDMHQYRRSGAACTTGIVVVFERIDTNLDGLVAVEWSVDAYGDAPRGWDGRTDEFTITIED